MNNESGNIVINSEEIMSAVGILDESLNTLQGSMQSSIGSSFTPLIETDLFTEGINKIAKQIDSLATSNQNLMSKITVHAEEFASLEQELEQYATDFATNYSNYSNGYSGDYSNIADMIVNDIMDGKSVNEGDILSSIPKLTSTEQTKLIEFIKINKDSNTTVQELLLNPEKSGALLVLLKKFYGDTNTDLTEAISENSYTAQKLLLQAIISSELQETVLDNKTILSAKEYLTAIAKENNITFEELVLENKNEKILLDAIVKAYDGDALGGYSVDSQEIEAIREAVDTIATQNNVGVDAILTNPEYLDELKGI